MSFRPILYSTPMVQANHADRKNQTRRLNGLEMFNEAPDNWRYDGIDKDNPSIHYFERLNIKGKPTEQYQKVLCPYGQVGDVLWVRETCRIVNGKFIYKTDDPATYADASGNAVSPWKPSIHMPAAACRSWCIITGIECQRLQDISPADAIGEGIEEVPSDMPITWRNYEKGFEWDGLGDATQSFQSLWESINGKESWGANPWVWVVRYEHTTTPPAGWDEYLQGLKSKRRAK